MDERNIYAMSPEVPSIYPLSYNHQFHENDQSICISYDKHSFPTEFPIFPLVFGSSRAFVQISIWNACNQLWYQSVNTWHLFAGRSYSIYCHWIGCFVAFFGLNRYFSLFFPSIFWLFAIILNDILHPYILFSLIHIHKRRSICVGWW